MYHPSPLISRPVESQSNVGQLMRKESPHYNINDEVRLTEYENLDMDSDVAVRLGVNLTRLSKSEMTASAKPKDKGIITKIESRERKNPSGYVARSRYGMYEISIVFEVTHHTENPENWRRGKTYIINHTDLHPLSPNPQVSEDKIPEGAVCWLKSHDYTRVHENLVYDSQVTVLKMKTSTWRLKLFGDPITTIVYEVGLLDKVTTKVPFVTDRMLSRWEIEPVLP